MSYKDDELSIEELNEIKAGIKDGNLDKTLNKLSASELKQLKDIYNEERELSLEELDNIKAGIPTELIEQEKEKNKDIFINK